MKNGRLVSMLFLVAALYDGLLGLFFMFWPGVVFEWFGVTAPNHWGYVQFPATLLIIFGVMFAAIARAPIANRGLIIYGILLKISYCGVVFRYWFAGGIPGMWKPFAIFDLIFLALFIMSYKYLCKQRTETSD